MDFNLHLDEEELERYSLRDTPETELERIEEHLLLCPSCRQRAESADAFVDSMRMAAARLRGEMKPPPKWFAKPRFTFALAVALLALTAAILIPRKITPPFAVALAATRGAAVETKAPANTPLDLHPDVTGLPSAAFYKVAMVDQAGKQVWAGTFPGALIGRSPAGVYFVRLYSPAGALLREYGLELESPR